MAERTNKGRKKKAEVIDVGDTIGTGASAEETTEEDEDKEDDEGVDADLAAAAIDVGDETPDEELPEPKERGGSLARRDPLAAYMAETRRYPLLTPEEE